jgi:hypothetical protein
MDGKSGGGNEDNMIKKNRWLYLTTIISLLLILFLVSACDSKPSGAFTATGFLGVKTTVTFNGNNMEMQTPLGGRVVYKYEIRNNGTEIILTDVANNKSDIFTFKYVKDPPCVVLNGTAYYR